MLETHGNAALELQLELELEGDQGLEGFLLASVLTETEQNKTQRDGSWLLLLLLLLLLRLSFVASQTGSNSCYQSHSDLSFSSLLAVPTIFVPLSTCCKEASDQSKIFKS